MDDILDLDILLEDPRWQIAAPDLDVLIDSAVDAALRAAGEDEPVSVTVVLADDATVQDLNRTWRDQDKPTNVLSFATRDSGAPLPPEGPEPLGDIILAYETCAAEAVSEEKAFVDHLAHLIVHGVLHLLGYDHQEPQEASEMELLEIDILKGLGVADPYAGGDLVEVELR